MILLEFDEVIAMHTKLIDKTGGSHGVRDSELLKGALENPFQTFEGKELYPSNIEKISVLTHSVINDHCMMDGNKRLGISLMGVLCRLNNINITYTQSELIKLGLDIAEGKLDKKAIRQWIFEHIYRHTDI